MNAEITNHRLTIESPKLIVLDSTRVELWPKRWALARCIKLQKPPMLNGKTDRYRYQLSIIINDSINIYILYIER
jgi:hypothetical protein